MSLAELIDKGLVASYLIVRASLAETRLPLGKDTHDALVEDKDEPDVQ